MKTADIKIFSRLVIVSALSALGLAACSNSDTELPANVDYSLIEYINEPYQPFEPELGAAVPQTSAKVLKAASLPYPPFNPHDIKTIGPEGWGDRDQLADAGIGGVKFNLIWSQWQPKPNLNPNDPNTFTYDGQVWRVSSSREKQIRWYTDRGIKVTAVIYGTPEWARKKNTANVGSVPLVDEKFIAPDNPEDFARFAGMLARRFNGANGNGRIVNFVVQNEVNALDWYNPGCGAASAPCSIPDRINSYAEIFNLTYDRIVAEQEHARVMFSFDHHFGMAYATNERFSSAQQFIEALDPMVGDRQWRLAFHSYPPDLFRPEFGPYDYPKITFGNLGILASYLRKTFPDKPYTWDIHLTENGINSGSPSSEKLMDQQLKVATRNVLGTPGIETYYYHRLVDHRQEGDFTPGLFNSKNDQKRAWTTWSTNNLYNEQPQQLADGYEMLPYVRLERSVHPQKGHWASTRQAPAGYTTEAAYLLLREPANNTTLLYECHDNRISATFLSVYLNCEGNDNYGPVGYIFKANNANGTRNPLYSLKVGTVDYLISNNPDEAGGTATLLGYVDTVKARQQALPARDMAYFNTDAASSPTQSTGNNNPNPAQVAPVKTALNSCVSDIQTACSYVQFNSTAGQTDTLSCSTRPQENITITLSYGNTENSTAENVVNTGSRTADGYDIPLNVADDATWASINISSDTNFIPNCTLLSEGGLQFGAANQDITDNLLYNGGFESAITDWRFCEDDTTGLFSTDAQEGSRAVEIMNGNCVFQEVEITAGESYTMSCQAYNNANSSGQATLRFALATNSYQTLLDNVQNVTGNNYQPYTATLSAPDHATYAVLTFQTDGQATLDNCSIVPASAN